MIALLQRTSSASVTVDDALVGRIGVGLLALLCVERGDTEREAHALLARTLALRVFPDAQGRMNRSLADLAADDAPGGSGVAPTDTQDPDADGGRRARAGLLLVPQFTLAADTRSGRRPSFTGAAPPDEGRRLFAHLVALARARHPGVETGIFGAEMAVALVNDGPVTIWLREAPAA